MDKFIHECLDKIAELNQAILKHRKGCSHKHVKLRPFRTGEFDNEYMYSVDCQSCGQFWTEDQDSMNKKIRNKEHYE